MEQDFYRERLGSHGLTVLVPGAEDRTLVHSVMLMTSCVRASSLKNPVPRTVKLSTVSLPLVRKGLCWAAPRLSSSLAKKTARCRFYPPHVYTWKPRWTRH